jgi:hypothetical protein
MKYENLTQQVLLGNAVLAILMCGRKYDVISQNGEYSRERNLVTLVFQNNVLYQNAMPLQTQYEKDPPSDNVIRR